MTAEDHDREQAPSYFFVSDDGEIDFWAPPKSDEGCLPADTLQRGVDLAQEALHLSKYHQSSMAIAAPLAAIARGGKVGLLEIGFIARISEAARCGSMG